MKLLKMLPLLLGLVFAAGSFTSVAIADSSVMATAGGAASHLPADPNRLMKDEYHYKETDDMFAFKFVLVGIAIAIIFAVISIATGWGKNKG